MPAWPGTEAAPEAPPEAAGEGCAGPVEGSGLGGGSPAPAWVPMNGVTAISSDRTTCCMWNELSGAGCAVDGVLPDGVFV